MPRPEKELKGVRQDRAAAGRDRDGDATSSTCGRSRSSTKSQAAWVAEAGSFEVLVGASSADIRARASFRLTADWREPVGMTDAAAGAA